MGQDNGPKTVVEGSVFAAFMTEATSAVQELTARRKFDQEVADFLKERKLTKTFEAWRKKRAG